MTIIATIMIGMRNLKIARITIAMRAINNKDRIEPFKGNKFIMPTNGFSIENMKTDNVTDYADF